MHATPDCWCAVGCSLVDCYHPSKRQQCPAKEGVINVSPQRGAAATPHMVTPPTPSRRDRRRAIEHYRHPSGEPLPGGPLPASEWPAALSRFSMLEPFGATCYFSFFTESIGWSYHRQNSETSTGECAAACLKTNGCTGFEFPENAEYCALWYHGNCDSGAARGEVERARVGGATPRRRRSLSRGALPAAGGTLEALGFLPEAAGMQGCRDAGLPPRPH
jgi:hypothetical protein